jgi:hypothetical protein
MNVGGTGNINDCRFVLPVEIVKELKNFRAFGKQIPGVVILEEIIGFGYVV